MAANPTAHRLSKYPTPITATANNKFPKIFPNKNTIIDGKIYIIIENNTKTKIIAIKSVLFCGTSIFIFIF